MRWWSDMSGLAVKRVFPARRNSARKKTGTPRVGSLPLTTLSWAPSHVTGVSIVTPADNREQARHRSFALDR